MRHLLAQSLYGRLVQYLVRKINQTTESRGASMGSLSSLKRDSSTFSCEAHNVCIIDSLAFQQTQVSEKSACIALRYCILNII